MNHARTLTRMFEAAGVDRSQDSQSVYVVADDAGTPQCFTEGMLDTWWANLSPERKAEVFERDLDGDPRDLVLHETLGRFSLNDVVARIQRLSDGFAEAIDRPYVRPAAQVCGEVDASAEIQTAPRSRDESLAAVGTFAGVGHARPDEDRSHRPLTRRAQLSLGQMNDRVLPMPRHPESLNRPPVDAVESGK